MPEPGSSNTREYHAVSTEHGDPVTYDETIGDDTEEVHYESDTQETSPARAYVVRSLALLCACSLSVGSHYASYILGPLKSRLSREMGTNNTEFSLLISAFSLNSTWTPLVGGLLANRLGTTLTSILATGVVLLGQLFLLIGNLTGSVRLMAFGMFVFGFGVSPLAVVQETIIVRFFKSHGLGVSLALGLVAGKGASFVSARTSYPLSQKFGPHAPFYVSTGLAALSFCINMIYLSASKWLVRGAGAELEASEIRAEAESQQQAHIRTGSLQSLSEAEALKEVAKKRMVKLRDITKLGDVFWAYIGLNILCGAIWSPFTHLAANIIQRRFDISESSASETASYLLVGSVFLYPITGWIVDTVKQRNIVLRLLTVSSVMTLLCYMWLAFPPDFTTTPIPGVVSYAFGQGFAPLLLVVLVPRIVPSKYVSTTLGAHKALEQTGSTIFQTMAGLLLDVKSKKPAPRIEPPISRNKDDQMQNLLNAFVFFNVLQLGSILCLRILDKRRHAALTRYTSASLPPVIEDDVEDEGPKEPSVEEASWDPEGPNNVDRKRHGTIRSIRSLRSPATSPVIEQSIPLLRHSRESTSSSSTRRNSQLITGTPHMHLSMKVSRGEIRRGRIFAVLSGFLIVFAWVLFMGTAWLRLRSKEERGNDATSYNM
ncbi:MFS general substrate transporter [Panus rudis PR-1116 ss-1]|nr:MFS general substrate transporter [Panus rudis PR-1116 ss-1]